MTTKAIQTFILLMWSLFSMSSHAAVNIVECEDKDGNRSFQKSCAPGSIVVGKKKLPTTPNKSKNSENKNSNIQATVYIIPNCNVCDEVREFLNVRNISIIEKNVHDNQELQNELAELAGALKVPTTVIGNEILSGYNRQDFMKILKAAGYEEKPKEMTEGMVKIK